MRREVSITVHEVERAPAPAYVVFGDFRGYQATPDSPFYDLIPNADWECHSRGPNCACVPQLEPEIPYSFLRHERINPC